jgi:hypothetical protein
MSSSEFAFKLFTRIIHDGAGETLVPVIGGKTGGSPNVRTIFLDRGA